LKFFIKFGFTTALRILAAGLVLYAPAYAVTARGTLTLKPVIQVGTDEVTLNDFVTNGDVEFLGAIVICRTPNAGSIRMVSLTEISATLKKYNTFYLLRGPEQISVLRSTRKLSAADLAPIIEAALNAQNMSAKVHEVQLQAAIFVNDVNSIKLRKLKFDPAINKYRAWFAIMNEPHAVPFEALATLDQGIAPLEIKSTKTDALASVSPLLVKRGETAAMLVDGSGFSATISVVCLENGPAEKVIRVREQATKHIYRAQIIARGQLHAISREN
jgi:hypothetical protein